MHSDNSLLAPLLIHGRQRRRQSPTHRLSVLQPRQINISLPQPHRKSTFTLYPTELGNLLLHRHKAGLEALGAFLTTRLTSSSSVSSPPPTNKPVILSNPSTQLRQHSHFHQFDITDLTRCSLGRSYVPPQQQTDILQAPESRCCPERTQAAGK